MAEITADMPVDADGTRPPGAIDVARFVRREDDGALTLHLVLDNVDCPSCIQKIESRLGAMEGVERARLNFSTRRLALRWRRQSGGAARFVEALAAMGFAARPYDAEAIDDPARSQERRLLRALAVAGFAAANVMLISVAVWAGLAQDMGPATRALMHWVSALIALPAVAYAGRPFFDSAAKALRRGGLNMDVPISLAVVLAAGMSLLETVRGGEHVYFDAAVALLFFLLIGRFLDGRARGRARAVAENLLLLNAATATVVLADGRREARAAADVQADDIVAVATGDRVPVDGVVADGSSASLDTSLITGETLPRSVGADGKVFAGTLNVGPPLLIRATAVADDTLLAEIVRLMEAAEQGRARYRRLADRIAAIYAPAVHVLAISTFVGWWLIAGADWQAALLTAVAVLIVTCPCALGLAIPAVQVASVGALMRGGILAKSADGLERLASVDTVVFDKTGTLTVGRPKLVNRADIPAPALVLAGRLARESRHPLAKALADEAPPASPLADVVERPGLGLEATMDGVQLRLGRRAFVGLAPEVGGDTDGSELWLAVAGDRPVRFAFSDQRRPDAVDVIAGLRRLGLGVELLSGDRREAVRGLAAELGIENWRANCLPADKIARLEQLADEGRRILMVGDGLNDAPALAAAFASMSPATAADISRTAADFVFQGETLAPVLKTVVAARRARRLVIQNLGLAFAYNSIAVPLAMAGLVTPLIAAIAMSSSSLLVTLNGLRARRLRSLAS